MFRENKTVEPKGHISFIPSYDVNSRGSVIIESTTKLIGIALLASLNKPMYDIDIKFIDELSTKYLVSQVASSYE